MANRGKWRREKALAEQLAVHIGIDLMAEFGGQEIYFNKCLESFRQERDAEIRERFRKAKATTHTDGVAFKPFLELYVRILILRNVRSVRSPETMKIKGSCSKNNKREAFASPLKKA